MPDFTGKLSNDEVEKIKAFIQNGGLSMVFIQQPGVNNYDNNLSKRDSQRPRIAALKARNLKPLAFPGEYLFSSLQLRRLPLALEQLTVWSLRSLSLPSKAFSRGMQSVVRRIQPRRALCV